MILKNLVFLIATLFMIACDVRKPPEDGVNQDSIYDKTPTYDEGTSLYPADVAKFKEVLKNKYQYPYNTTAVEYGQFDGYKTKNFYVDKNEDFYFVLNKEHNTTKRRNELREGPESREWSTSDSDGNFWIATLKCFKPELDLQSYTWMQIHGTNTTFNYPLLRLLWVRNRAGIYDHNWAIVIISNPEEPKIYEWVDLGQRPDTFFTAAIHVQNNLMEIKINNVVIKTYNVSYWENVKNYYKAGIYINLFEDGGESVVAFRELLFLDWADPKYVNLTHY